MWWRAKAKRTPCHLPAARGSAWRAPACRLLRCRRPAGIAIVLAHGLGADCVQNRALFASKWDALAFLSRQNGWQESCF
jgi:hypothetical protein